MIKPIVWTIAGSDSGGGAGIQADLHTFHSLDVYGCTVITALTAQNSETVQAVAITTPDMITAQLQALSTDLPPMAIKIGMLGNESVMRAIKPFLMQRPCPIILDPVMISTSGAELLDPQAKRYLIEEIFPLATLITPNHYEAENLLRRRLTSTEDIETAAQDLRALGCQRILIKGGHLDSDFCQDYFLDDEQSCWLTIPRRQHAHTHGSGCTLSAAITAFLAQKKTLSDALVLAKTYISQAIRLAMPYGHGPGPVSHQPLAWHVDDFPWVTARADQGTRRLSFPSCHPEKIGFYPIVPDAAWVEKLLKLGVKTIQLRNKTTHGAALIALIKNCVQLANRYQARLFVNDHWVEALQCGAYGVHLGQSDLAQADLNLIARAGLRLGISTHNVTEVARAHAYQPSYVAIGPIYETATKIMPHIPQGIEQLRHWQQWLPYPLVAIGGIDLDKAKSVRQTGIDGIAVISAIMNAPQLEEATAAWLSLMQ